MPHRTVTLQGMHLYGEIRADRPLLAAALEVEAAHVRELGLPVLITGVGATAAAVAVSVALTQNRPSELISIGTAGSLRPDAMGTVVVHEVFKHDIDNVALASLVGFEPAPVLSLAPTYPGRPAVLATGDVFITDPTMRTRLAERADVVDMEGYAVASAARAVGVPLTLVKQVSDSADGTAARTWQQTMDACARALADWVRSVVR
jgi:adenosylhomocysteine nucleosidase